MEFTGFPPIPNDVPADEVVSWSVEQAVRYRASDLFYETHEESVTVSVRHLGLVRQMGTLSAEVGRRCISHIKVMSGLDVAERRRPQDGRWMRDVDDFGRVDLRVSTIPTLYGEDVAMRVLVRQFGLMDLDQLGLLPKNLNELYDILASPSGLILVTGPTGSGKTTTLYACLRYLNNGERKINTIEDPVEYAIERIRQSQINLTVGIDFPELLRAVLRQSPDIIMIGEIRDPLTATTAVRAANSGHLVLATLHAPIAAGAIQSMLSLGVHPHFLSSSLRGVIAQRLVRTLCPKCKQAVETPYAATMFEEVQQWLKPGEGEQLYEAKGCEACLQTGYAARTGLFEVLPMTMELRAMVQNRATTQQLREQAIKQGMMEMKQVALLKVARGETTVEEVLRIVPVEYLNE